MPRQAVGESEYLAGTLASKICDNEHTPPSLRHSPILRVQHGPSNVQRPAVCQFIECASEVTP